VSRGEAAASERDPLAAFNFEVALGDQVIGFAEVAGLGGEIDYGVPSAGAPGRTVSGRVGEVRLRRGVTGDAVLWSWFDRVLHGADDPRTVTITLLDAQRRPACAWVLTGARPTRWSGPHLVAGVPAPAVEELALAADGIEFRARR
jgi:phage tail-like protein